MIVRSRFVLTVCRGVAMSRPSRLALGTSNQSKSRTTTGEGSGKYMLHAHQKTAMQDVDIDEAKPWPYDPGSRL